MFSELSAKRMQILKEAVPKLSRVTLLLNPHFKTIAETNVRDYGAAAAQSDLGIEAFQARGGHRLNAAASASNGREL
jgi:hypothetical protein